MTRGFIYFSSEDKVSTPERYRSSRVMSLIDVGRVFAQPSSDFFQSKCREVPTRRQRRGLAVILNGILYLNFSRRPTTNSCTREYKLSHKTQNYPVEHVKLVSLVGQSRPPAAMSPTQGYGQNLD